MIEAFLGIIMEIISESWMNLRNVGKASQQAKRNHQDPFRTPYTDLLRSPDPMSRTVARAKIIVEGPSDSGNGRDTAYS
ncbi:hypothetical protein HNR65_001120 [Desulfosalsimonas propionicica]|uniref:Uncharacterized protein n=1 Tax=Desulfosalsimonas propionicica TaxID=332175 RepID=A0A7W0HK33_9BACT|nr:hypothetical protein [Desulfosalsimonas propionicica]MBA2880802.1 hypothetical protein [Desulfosalsimonas propionicica]